MSCPVPKKTHRFLPPRHRREALQAGETITANVVPGTYTILRFIDTGDDITADYNGYTLNFRRRNTYCTKGANTFTGTWKLNSAQTR
jgi:hypothetical protein